MTSITQRQQLILEWIHRHGETTVQELADAFSVSAMTIRRDLENLAAAGNIQRTRGGAKPFPPTSKSISPVEPKNISGKEQFSFLDDLDVVVLNPMDVHQASMLADECAYRGISLILESIPFAGSRPVVAIDSYSAGVSLGRWIGEYAQSRWEGEARILEIGWPEYEDTAERSRGLADGLAQTAPQAKFVLSINGRGMREEAVEVAAAALSVYPDINVIVGINDQCALGALDAIHQAHTNPEGMLLATFGLEGTNSRNELFTRFPSVVGVAMFPELVGRVCANVAIKAYNRLPLPDIVITPTDIVTSASIGNYYSGSNGKDIRWEAVHKLSMRDQAGDLMADPSPSLPRPRRIGFIKYLQDDYYDNLLKGFKERCDQLGIEARIIDASVNWDNRVDMARQQIAKIAASLVQEGESVILDAGRTCAQIAAYLSERHGITVITHSIPVIKALEEARGVRVICIGGLMDPSSQSFVGSTTQAAYRELQADKAFLSAEGVDIQYGISNDNIVEGEVKRAIIDAAREVTVVADFSKLGKVTLSRIVPISAVQRLVTDGSLTPGERIALAKAGVELMAANRKNQSASNGNNS